jgi:putative transposase
MCHALGYPPASLYRALKPQNKKLRKRGGRSPRKLSQEEESHVHDILNSPKYCDMSPPEIFTTLLDKGRYHCSVRTMYRILQKHGQTTLRQQARAKNYARPELLATRENELWSWDITKLKGPRKWQYFHLYKIMDVYSRYVVGWMVADREKDDLAKKLIEETILRQNIRPETLTLHADRGSSMKSNTVAQLLSSLRVTKTHSRPHVSNDNPYSEAAFKTLKYKPDFPDRFGCVEHARAHCRAFFEWYNTKHHHSGIEMFTPEQVHYGTWRKVYENRKRVLQKAAEENPERFVKGKPVLRKIPSEVWINKPKSEEERELVKTGK